MFQWCHDVNIVVCNYKYTESFHIDWFSLKLLNFYSHFWLKSKRFTAKWFHRETTLHYFLFKPDSWCPELKTKHVNKQILSKYYTNSANSGPDRILSGMRKGKSWSWKQNNIPPYSPPDLHYYLMRNSVGGELDFCSTAPTLFWAVNSNNLKKACKWP